MLELLLGFVINVNVVVNTEHTIFLAGCDSQDHEIHLVTSETHGILEGNSCELFYLPTHGDIPADPVSDFAMSVYFHTRQGIAQFHHCKLLSTTSYNQIQEFNVACLHIGPLRPDRSKE